MLTEETLRETVGEELFAQGRALFYRVPIREARRSRAETVYLVAGEEKHLVAVTARSSRCDCGRHPCPHAVAALLAALESGAQQEMEKHLAQETAPALLEAVSGMLPESDGIRLQPALFLTRDGLRIGLRIGEERLYVVRHIPHFLSCREKGEALSFGKGFEYRPQWMHFDEKQNRLLDILAEVCEYPGQRTLTGMDARVMLLPPRAAGRVLEALQLLPFTLQADGQLFSLPGISASPLPLRFHLSGDQRRLALSAELPDTFLPLTKDFSFVLWEDACFMPPRSQRPLAAALHRFAARREASAVFAEADTQRVVSDLVPFLLREGQVTIEPELEKRFVRLPLKAQVYLDKSGPDVVARTVFRYGEIAVDPFSPESPLPAVLLLRDAPGEKAVLDELAGSGFHVGRGRVYLSGSEKVYDFVTEGAQRLARHAEVFFSRDFQRLRPRKPLFSGALRLKNGRLELEMTDGGTPVEELLPLLEALRNRRRYFRFKEGTFLDLSDADAWQPLADAVAEARENTGGGRIGACWAAYFSVLIRENGLSVTLDAPAARAAGMAYTPPPAPVAGLRPYQERGYQWLMALHALGMGGILADDMGLGKTVQTLSALLSCVQREKERRPSLIVAPTSLTYNWLSE